MVYFFFNHVKNYLFCIEAIKILIFNWNKLLQLDGFLSKVIAISTIFLALKGVSDKITVTFANTFKSIKERQLLLSQ